VSGNGVLPERARVLLDFWFGPPGDPQREQRRQIWFRGPPDFDATLDRLFRADHERAAAGELAAWETAPHSALALVLLLDQLPRNIFRGTPRAYQTDALARAAASRVIAQGFDQALPPVWRWFIYLPFEHSEDIADQSRAVELFATVPDGADPERGLRIVLRHHEIIERFGRFPHRNAILGRASTPEEIEFLKEPDSAF
jgi:uncharacterized protein (DUF924 family)